MKAQLCTVALALVVLFVCAASTAEASAECAICEFIAQEAENFIQNDHTEAEIKDLLLEACALLPKQYTLVCKITVKTQTSAIIKRILAKETPEVVCQQLSLCPAEETPVEEISPTVGGGDLECSLCTLIVSEVEKIVGENKTEANIEKALDQVCDILPSALSGPCETLVNRYTPALIALIAQDFPADVVCSKIGLCKDSEEPHPVGGFECAACEYIANVVEQFMGNNHTESEIVEFVDKLCSFLPSALKGECDVIIETYGPVIIDYIINKEDPQTLCTQIGLCKREMPAQEEPPHPAPLGGLECAACEYLMSLAESVLGNNATEQEIVKFVDQVCTLLPGVLKAPCEAIIDEYGPELIQFLINREDPATFCGQIGLCKKTEHPAGQSFLCPVCTVAISYLENYITSNSTEAEITSLVEGLCNALPSVLAMPCDVFVEQYGAHLINWLVAKEPPSKFCSTIGLCSSSSPDRNYVHVKRTLNTRL